jgi:hypothetical protein
MTIFSVQMDERKQKEVKVTFQGDPILLGKMIAHAMDTGPHVAATVIAAAQNWCAENGRKLIFVK